MIFYYCVNSITMCPFKILTRWSPDPQYLPVPVIVTLFENKVFADVIKIRWGS